MVPLGNFFFRYRNGLFPLVFLLALMAGRPAYPLGDPGLDALFDVIGVLLAMLGLNSRGAARMYCTAHKA